MVAAGAATGAVCRGAARVAPRRGSSTLCTLAFGMYRAWTLYACEYGERACACLPALGSPPSGARAAARDCMACPAEAVVRGRRDGSGGTRGDTSVCCENPNCNWSLQYLYGAHHPHDSIYGYEVTKVGKRRLGSGGERRRGTNYGRGTTG